MRILALLLISVFFQHITAQENASFIISGAVYDHEGSPIKSVKVSSINTSVYTNVKGEYFFKINSKEKLKLKYKHVGFLEYAKSVGSSRLKKIQANDTLYLDNIVLKEKLLDEFTFFSKKTDTVFGSKQLSVEDFELIEDDRMILLAYEKSLKKESKVVLTDNDQTILHTYIVPDNALCLYKDFGGRVFVIAANKVFLVNVNSISDKIKLERVKDEDFYGYYHRVIDTLDNYYFYSNFNELYPSVKFYSTLKEDTSHKLIREVKDDFMMELYRAQYKYVSGRDKLWAYRKEQATGIDKEIWIGASYFTQDILYQPVYAPLFIKGDTIFIFDNYKDYLIKFDKNSEVLDSVKINYHHKKKGIEKWNEPLIQDVQTEKIFGIFHRGGITILKLIDTDKGVALKNFQLAYKYVEKIKVADGYVYYTYRPYESLQKKFIYRERITIY